MGRSVCPSPGRLSVRCCRTLVATRGHAAWQHPSCARLPRRPRVRLAAGVQSGGEEEEREEVGEPPAIPARAACAGAACGRGAAQPDRAQADAGPAYRCKCWGRGLCSLPPSAGTRRRCGGPRAAPVGSQQQRGRACGAANSPGAGPGAEGLLEDGGAGCAGPGAGARKRTQRPAWGGASPHAAPWLRCLSRGSPQSPPALWEAGTFLLGGLCCV